MIDTVLVVEDEKMIRQGIATMIRRCETGVGEVLECPDGEKALEIIKSRPVDLVFTDIRMPKMNGIQLVQNIQQLDEIPLVVAISGYDDFEYAVQMLRNGVKEYILKPVEREKIKEVVSRLDEEITLKKKDRDLKENTGNKLLKYLLLDKDATPKEMEDLENLLVSHVGKEYCVMIGRLPKASEGIRINIHEGAVCILPATDLENTAKENQLSYVGLSDPSGSVSALKSAYEQALARRKRAFLESTGIVREEKREASDKLIEDAKHLTEAAVISASVQRLGAAGAKEVQKDFEKFFKAAQRGYIPYEDFEAAIRTFCLEFTSVFKREIPEKLIRPLMSDHLEDYQQSFHAFLNQISSELASEDSENENDRKMREAIAYIHNNYKKDLSMTVVSNMVSMNYTLFSTQFKQYTGNNFVNYVREVRINEAKKLLQDTDLRITEVGTAVGYDNEKHFLKSFKAAVGVTPSEYRKNTGH